MKKDNKIILKSDWKIAWCIKYLISKEVHLSEIKDLSDEIFIVILS